MENKTPGGEAREVEILAVEATRRFIIEVEELMERRLITKAELARRMGVSPAQVTRLLAGRRNLTIRSMAAIAHALGRQPVLRLRRRPPSLPEDLVPELKKPRKKE